MRASLLVLTLLAAAAVHAQTPARKRKAPAKKPAPAGKPASKPSVKPPARPVPAPVVAEDEDLLEGEGQALPAPRPEPVHHLGTFVSPAGALGASLADTPAGLLAGEPLPGSPAAAAGLKEGDRLAAVWGKPTQNARDASSALGGWPMGARFSAVVIRGLETRRLEAPAPSVPAERARAKNALSPQEASLKEARLDAAAESAARALKAAKPLEFPVHSRQAFWIKFKSGLREDAAPGAVFVGETTTAVATSADLDFLSLPPKSKIWARLLSLETTTEVRKARLHIFKLQPAGGHPYRVSGLVTDLVGDQRLLKVSPGGTIVSAQPLERPAKGKPLMIVEPETRLRAELLETTTLTEAPSFFRAGPGLWLRTKEGDKGRRFEISHVIAGRSADKAGLKVGQLVTAIGGRGAERLEFADALDALYGAPGSELRLSVERDTGKPETVTLKRGVLYAADGTESLAPSPAGR